MTPPSPFRAAVAAQLPSELAVERLLGAMTAQGWQEVGTVFAARLPEFGVVVAAPDAQELARAVARVRGVPVLGGDWTGEPGAPALVLTGQLRQGEPERDAVLAARAQGLCVEVLGAAIERTSLGGRHLLGGVGVRVRAAVQLADAPWGLLFERRAPDRWSAAS
ncbi:hypothetical protein [Deinococcus petrolearius]|uniref:Uncharacterized protein n=1 Tax=Deinococcus petrolearius TaxID=1751295 RepID=A0ABW1DHD7_9DEIO